MENFPFFLRTATKEKRKAQKLTSNQLWCFLESIFIWFVKILLQYIFLCILFFFHPQSTRKHITRMKCASFHCLPSVFVEFTAQQQINNSQFNCWRWCSWYEVEFAGQLIRRGLNDFLFREYIWEYIISFS